MSISVFARHALTGYGREECGAELLLEGSWPVPKRRSGRWSLDDAIDARFARIDRIAMDLADRTGRTGEFTPHVSPARQAATFPYINALALRYHLVKLLRVVVFFRDVRPLEKGELVELHLSSPEHEAYADLFGQMAAAQDARLVVHRHEAPPTKRAHARRDLDWRRWASRLRTWQPPVGKSQHDPGAPRVVLCGSPRILNPVCAELVSRGARVAWLYDRFAVRCWWSWRSSGVEQLVCDTGRPSASSFNDVWAGGPLAVDGLDLARPVDRWLTQRATELGRSQLLLIDRVESHFRNIRPTALVLDEDATPLKRIAVALARSHGARSTVVQHGAPCGPFGFLPPAADEIAVWGDTTRQQLETWGHPAERIRLVGWPGLRRQLFGSAPAERAPTTQAKRFLLLATMPPRDERPDNVEFHLTSDSYAAMFDMVYRVLGQIDSATLTIKLHPRDARQAQSIPLPPGWRDDGRAKLRVRIVQSADLASLVAASDCVLSCASTAGIEAALAGAPVVQILPAGSGNVLPAEDWGLLGSARTAEELTELVTQALERGWRQVSHPPQRVLVAHGRTAAARIVDGLVDRPYRNEPASEPAGQPDSAVAECYS
ncbi:MAG TPA: hypothetical protein VHC22_08710 [Pirellulales bacterium]|nr:hypothetical protein [Pirellulales bacterium]